MSRYRIFVVFFLILGLSIKVKSLEKELTVYIEPGKRECFYQEIKEGQVIDIEYQVIDGTHGELDISFQLAEPNGRVLFADFKKFENSHRVDAKINGDYQFCFDNTFSSFNKKTVFFEVIVEGEGESLWGDNDLEEDHEELIGLTPNEIYDVQIMEIMNTINRVREQLNEIEHHQNYLRTHEARDRNIAEENFFRVNVWSGTTIVVMFVVGLIQVVMLKSLFDSSSTVHKVWRKLNS